MADKLVIQWHEFDVTIYPERTALEWFKAGKYFSPNPTQDDLNNFSRFMTVDQATTVPYRAKVVAFSLHDSFLTIDRAKQIRARLHLKPVGFEHLAAIAEQHEKVLRKSELDCWLINPDIVLKYPQNENLYTLCVINYPLALQPINVEGECADHVRFLGLKK